MNQLRKILGIVWILIGPALFFLLLRSAVINISSDAKGDISNPVPWIIILFIFLPIAAGLTLFGWYSLKGEYENTPDHAGSKS